ncbi:hypothetical protein WG904_11880 [Pedobacter sp. Du54]|uniref:hypothetical protein n=1 Tax=Pedobacter anseongensis TaxID=3133439 RepID=UPI0030B443AD
MKKAAYLRFCLLFLILSLSNCKDPSAGVEINVNTTSLFKSPFLVRFENANPNSGNKIGDFAITITGKDAAFVQMGTGGTNFKVSQGIIPLALTAKAKPTPSNPINFTINAEIPGYETIAKNIVVTNDSSLVFVIPAFDFTTKVSGTSVINSETILKNGITTEAITITTTTTPLLSEKVTITIPMGTEMRNGSNKLIDADALRSTVTFYGTSPSSLKAAFPQGINTLNAYNSSGNIIPYGITYVPAGVLKLDMFAGPSQVAYFSKPVEISQELPNGLINYETKAPVKVGETIPLWISYSPSGRYQTQNTPATIVAGTGGKLIAKYTVSNTAIENLSWGYSTIPQPLNRSLVVNFNPIVSPFTGGYSIHALTTKDIYLFYISNYQAQTNLFQQGALVNNTTVYTTIQGKYGYSFPTTPNVNSMRLFIYSSQGKLVGQTPSFDPTTTSVVNVAIDNTPVITTPTGPTGPVTPPKPIEYIKVKANFIGKCSNKNITSPINTWVTINDKTNNSSTYVYVKNGIIDNATNSIQLIVDHEYNLSTTYNGDTYVSKIFPLSKADQVLNTGVDYFTASLLYNSSLNILELVGNLTQECK